MLTPVNFWIPGFARYAQDKDIADKWASDAVIMMSQAASIERKLQYLFSCRQKVAYVSLIQPVLATTSIDLQIVPPY